MKTGRRSNERIVRFANSVLKGKPTFADATLVESDDASTPARIEEIVQQLRAAGRSDNVQILAATRNLVGEINRRLRLPLPVGEKRVRAVHGDRVIVTKNSYDRQKPNRTVLNGEVGTLHIQTKDGETTFSIEIAHDDVRGPFPIQEIKMLDLAYAMTIHKSQGSEWDIVILAVPEQRWQLSRPLLYTAATRARSEFILVGCKASVSNAASRSPARSTALRVLLERDAPAALPLQPPSDVARSSESRCQPDELGDPA